MGQSDNGDVGSAEVHGLMAGKYHEEQRGAFCVTCKWEVDGKSSLRDGRAHALRNDHCIVFTIWADYELRHHKMLS